MPFRNVNLEAPKLWNVGSGASCIEAISDKHHSKVNKNVGFTFFSLALPLLFFNKQPLRKVTERKSCLNSVYACVSLVSCVSFGILEDTYVYTPDSGKPVYPCMSWDFPECTQSTKWLRGFCFLPEGKQKKVCTTKKKEEKRKKEGRILFHIFVRDYQAIKDIVPVVHKIPTWRPVYHIVDTHIHTQLYTIDNIIDIFL